MKNISQMKEREDLGLEDHNMSDSADFDSYISVLHYIIYIRIIRYIENPSV